MCLDIRIFSDPRNRCLKRAVQNFSTSCTIVSKAVHKSERQEYHEGTNRPGKSSQIPSRVSGSRSGRGGGVTSKVNEANCLAEGNFILEGREWWPFRSDHLKKSEKFLQHENLRCVCVCVFGAGMTALGVEKSFCGCPRGRPLATSPHLVDTILSCWRKCEVLTDCSLRVESCSRSACAKNCFL